MDLIFLGTSGATPTKNRNLPAVAIRLDTGNIVLFDAGEDVQRRFQEAKLRFNVPTWIFISHLHGDHVIGLPGLLFNFHIKNRTEDLHIFGPPGIASYLLNLHDFIGLKAENYNLYVSEINPISQKDCVRSKSENKMGLTEENSNEPQKDSSEFYKIIHYDRFLTSDYSRSVKIEKIPQIYSNEEFSISSLILSHSVLNYGFRLQEHPRNGKFNPERALELKIPRKKYWNLMHTGKKVVLHDGREIDPVKEGIVSPKRAGRIIVYTGDTAMCDNLITLAQHADYLICEATYHQKHEMKAIEKHHLTAKFAGQVAHNASVKKLFLTHFSSRYEDSELNEMLDQAKELHEASFIGKDLLKIQLPMNMEDNEK